jgi:hypothetical protein
VAEKLHSMKKHLSNECIQMEKQDVGWRKIGRRKRYRTPRGQYPFFLIQRDCACVLQLSSSLEIPAQVNWAMVKGAILLKRVMRL